MNRRQFLGAAAGIGSSLLVSACLSTAGFAARQNTGSSEAAAFHARRRYAPTSFGNIAYVERGRGDAALFLHGFPLNGYQWRGALERLAPYRRCVAPDFLGLGYTQVAEGQRVDPDAQVGMLVALLDHLQIDSVDLVANDSGITVAQLLLLQHPRRVRTLLLTNGDTEIDSPPAAMRPVIELAKRGVWADQWLGPWHADPTLARSADGIGGLCYADARHPTDDAIDTYFGPLLSTVRRTELANAYAVALERNALAGTAAALQRTRTPVRIVWGMADTIFAPANADYLDRTFGGSRGVRRLEGSKLFWPEERPDVIAQEARALWNAWVPQAVVR